MALIVNIELPPIRREEQPWEEARLAGKSVACASPRLASPKWEAFESSQRGSCPCGP
jgi:hypothetical protein